MCKPAAVFLILSFFLICGPVVAESQTSPAQLIQYVRDARKAGLNDNQIRVSAEKAGWPRDGIERALAAVAPTAAAPIIPPAAVQSQSPPTQPAQSKAAGNAPPSGIAPTSPTAEPASKERNAPDDYQIGAGDVLHISVWKELDASVQSVVVRPDGKISMPLLKEVPVLGLTVVQAEQLITNQLAKFLTAPDVTIVVQAINSKKIYIMGAVNKEGPIPYTYRMTVLQALTEAGGVTDYAKRKKIYVLRNQDGRQFTFPFDYNEVVKGRHMETNIYLTPGDTVVVPH